MELEKNTQAKLLEVATPLFALKGLNGVSVRQLANAAEVNIAAVSYYFRGKEGLYQAVLEDQFAPIAAALTNINLAKELPAAQQLELYARQIAGVHRKRPFFIRFMFNEVTNPTPFYDSIVKRYVSHVFHFLQSALAKGIADGDFNPSLNIKHAVISLAGILNFYFVTKPLANAIMPLEEDNDEAYTRQAFQIYLEGIRRREA